MNKKKTYKEMLLDPRWQKKRLEIMKRDDFTCQHCGSTKRTLQVHHFIYHKDVKPWEYEDEELITLCERCHNAETEAKSDCYEEFKVLQESCAAAGFSYEMLSDVLGTLSNFFSCYKDLQSKELIESNVEKDVKNIVRDSIYCTQNIYDIKRAQNIGINFDDAFLKQVQNEIKYR